MTGAFKHQLGFLTLQNKALKLVRYFKSKWTHIESSQSRPVSVKELVVTGEELFSNTLSHLKIQLAIMQ